MPTVLSRVGPHDLAFHVVDPSAQAALGRWLELRGPDEATTAPVALLEVRSGIVTATTMSEPDLEVGDIRFRRAGPDLHVTGPGRVCAEIDLESATGRIVLAEDDPPGMAATLRTTLKPVLSLVLARLGWHGIHGAALVWRGCGLVLLGESGSGKSTTAWKLGQRGHRFITDDLTLVDDARRLAGPADQPSLGQAFAPADSRPGVTRSTDTPPAGLIVWLGAPGAPCIVDPADVFTYLLAAGNVGLGEVLDPRRLAVLARLVESVPCIGLPPRTDPPSDDELALWQARAVALP